MSAPKVFVIPQWQGSSRSTAEEMAAGATLLAQAFAHDGDIDTVDAPDLPRGGAAVAAVRQVLARMLAQLDPTDPITLLGGDCSVDGAALARSLADPDVAVVWLDAHPDANTAISSPSGAPHGMVARTELAEDPQRLVYVGTRAMDPEERRWIDQHAIPVLGTDATPQQLREATGERGAVHVHLDLDVLDPGWFAGLAFPEPHGMKPAVLVDLLASLTHDLEVRCLTVTECVPPTTQKRLDADRAVLVELAAAIHG
ncbi:MAG TPA: arginase family protein [Euzebya sp.]|nr:arginase family protein [Euzebya sp.]